MRLSLQPLASDRWPDDRRLSDLKSRFICSACDKRGADVRPDFNWQRTATIVQEGPRVKIGLGAVPGPPSRLPIGKGCGR
jgi:hypothetical protein